MINIGDDPQGREGLNKYIEENGDGWRGTIVAFNKDHTEAVMRGDSRPTTLILVREYDPACYPKFAEEVKALPKGFTLVSGIKHPPSKDGGIPFKQKVEKHGRTKMQVL